MRHLANAIKISDSKVIVEMPNIINGYVNYLVISKTNISKVNAIYDSLHPLLNEQQDKYNLSKQTVNKLVDNCLTDIEFQKVLSNLNEKQSVRLVNGVFYTPVDVVNFIIYNCFNKSINFDTNTVSNSFDDDINLLNIELLAFKRQVFDPTCGTGEFLYAALQHKINLYSRHNKINDRAILNILKTIHGNDINSDSIDIVKVRLFFEVIKYISNKNKYIDVISILNKNMTVNDFVNVDKSRFKTYHIIVGNPPYVEDSKSSSKAINKYGNIYANVLQNSLDILTNDGVMGFIVPISYISTPRMGVIRRYIEQNTNKQFVLNYADRPDCLFTSVHQKLSILIAVKGDGIHKMYSSSYNYWYKSERDNLFNLQKVCTNPYINDSFYPKIGNKFELSIFEKVYTTTENNIIQMSSCNVVSNVFLNMRACFWIKAFSFNPGSKEYKGFGFNDDKKDFILCLLNSSLYFLFWNIVSDCWHITTKELKYFRIPNKKINTKLFSELAIKLESELERTKKYIGSKQTEYEYKHRLCKNTIDKIDVALVSIYKFTKAEVFYIKTFASKYRESTGA